MTTTAQQNIINKIETVFSKNTNPFIKGSINYNFNENEKIDVIRRIFIDIDDKMPHGTTINVSYLKNNPIERLVEIENDFSKLPCNNLQYNLD